MNEVSDVCNIKKSSSWTVLEKNPILKDNSLVEVE